MTPSYPLLQYEAVPLSLYGIFSLFPPRGLFTIEKALLETYVYV